MLVIGIAGGIASGKSLVTRQLEQFGAAVLDADRVGHEVLREPAVKEAIRQRWGDNVFGQDGQVDRRELAKIVFAPSPDGPQELTHLEQITHPRIGSRLRESLEELAARQVTAVVLDAAVMFKVGWDKMCDRILFVDAPLELRRRRAESRGWTAEQFAAREATQENMEFKRRRADWVIDNSGTADETMEQVREFWRSLDGTGEEFQI